MRHVEVMDTCYFIILRCTFLLLFLPFIHEAKRCEETGDCENPGLDQFCDETFGACMGCSGYCTGAVDALPLCLQNCPKKYWMMFRSTTTDGEQQQEQSTTTADGVQTQQSTTGKQIQERNPRDNKQEEGLGEQKPEPYFGEKKHEQNSGQTTGSNVYVIIFVGATCGFVLVAAIAFVFQYRRRKGSISLRDAENPIEINWTEMNNMAEANPEALTKTIPETEVTQEQQPTTGEKETEFIAEQTDVEPCKEFSQCVPSGMKDVKGDDNNTYLKCPKENLTETTAEELKRNTAKQLPAKLQSLGSRSLGNGSTTSFC